MHMVLGLLQEFFSKQGIHDLIVHGGYIALALIVFAETGLLIGFFLPGDSLLVIAGLLIKTGAVEMDIFLLNVILIVAAILGDATGYLIGRSAGHKLYNRPDSRFFKREHLMRTHAFYEKHGGKVIIMARFIPVVRTFAPVVAGAADMGYKKFALYNISGGILWIVATTMLGYLVASVVPDVERYIYLVIGIVILLSILPPFFEWYKTRRKREKALAD